MERRAAEASAAGPVVMGRYVHTHTTDKSDPRHWRLRRLQQQAYLSLLPASEETASAPAEPEESGEFDDGMTVVDEAWLRRAGRLDEGQSLEAVTHLELQAMDAPRLLGLECLGGLLPGLEVR